MAVAVWDADTARTGDLALPAVQLAEAIGAALDSAIAKPHRIRPMYDAWMMWATRCVTSMASAWFEPEEAAEGAGVFFDLDGQPRDAQGGQQPPAVNDGAADERLDGAQSVESDDDSLDTVLTEWSGPLAEDLPMPTIDFDVAWAWSD